VVAERTDLLAGKRCLQLSGSGARRCNTEVVRRQNKEGSAPPPPNLIEVFEPAPYGWKPPGHAHLLVAGLFAGGVGKVEL